MRIPRRAWIAARRVSMRSSRRSTDVNDPRRLPRMIRSPFLPGSAFRRFIVLAALSRLTARVARLVSLRTDLVFMHPAYRRPRPSTRLKHSAKV